MPAYNAAAYFQEAIDSVLKQSFRDFELWLINDGSSDETPAIAKAYVLRDARIKFFSNESNQGRVLTINALVHQVSSPFFTITDADDVSHPKRLEAQLLLLRSEPQLMMCGTSYMAMDERGFIIRKEQVLHSLEDLRKRSLLQSAFLGPTTIMRREVLTAFPEFYRLYFKDNMADADLSCRILDRYAATNLTEHLYFYRIVPHSLTRNAISIRKLNLHKLIAKLSEVRRGAGQDYLETDNSQAVHDFMNTVERSYQSDASLFYQHKGFFHLYWGQNALACRSAVAAVCQNFFSFRSYAVLLFIVFRVFFSSAKRVLNKEHYSKFI